MVVWEDGAMKKSDYRKFQIKTVDGVDDFASMREVVTRRYSRVPKKNAPCPASSSSTADSASFHAAAQRSKNSASATQPLASIAKREELIYLYGQEDEPIVLDRRSPVLHLIQRVRDESHRFAITYHRKRREMRDRDSGSCSTIPRRRRTQPRHPPCAALRTASAASEQATVREHLAQRVVPHDKTLPNRSITHFHPSEVNRRSAAFDPRRIEPSPI